MQGQKIHEIRDEIAQLRREEALLDHHREYIQGILKSMSENKSFKRYSTFIADQLKACLCLAYRY